MAKPTAATPTFYRKDAKRFLARMKKKERSKMTKKEAIQALRQKIDFAR